jgi:hypothetical protein
MIIALILLFFSLGAIFWQDNKMRQIHVVLPLMVFSCAFLSIKNFPFKYSIVFNNLIFFFTTFVALIIYMSIKNKKYINPFKNYFGLGDLLFYIAITPLFLLRNYIVFFVCSMIFAIGMQFLFKKYISQDSVPLAGLSSVLLIFIILNDTLFSWYQVTLIKL